VAIDIFLSLSLPSRAPGGWRCALLRPSHAPSSRGPCAAPR
jgi:hypothetical protein